MAKTYLRRETSLDDELELRDELVHGRLGKRVAYEVPAEHGGWDVWDKMPFEMAKVLAGRWVQRQELERVHRGAAVDGTVLLDESKVGCMPVDGNGEWWGDVVAGTGTAEGSGARA